jgi:hypothetical protein
MDFWFEFLNIQMNEKTITCHGFKWQNLNIYQILTLFFLVVQCPFWLVGLWLHPIKGIYHVQLEKKLVGVKVQSALDVMDYCFTFTLGCYFKLVLGKCVAKVWQNWRHKVQLVNWCKNSPSTMGQTLHEGLVMVKRWVAPRTCAIWHEMWPCAIWEQSWNDCENLYLEFLGWKHFWKCSKIILEGGHLQINVICVGIPVMA